MCSCKASTLMWLVSWLCRHSTMNRNGLQHPGWHRITASIQVRRHLRTCKQSCECSQGISLSPESQADQGWLSLYGQSSLVRHMFQLNKNGVKTYDAKIATFHLLRYCLAKTEKFVPFEKRFEFSVQGLIIFRTRLNTAQNRFIELTQTYVDDMSRDFSPRRMR